MLITAEQDFFLSSIAPSKPKNKADLLFLISESITLTDDPEIIRIANACNVLISQMSDKEYENLNFSEATA